VWRSVAGAVGAVSRGVAAQARAVVRRVALPGVLVRAWRLWEAACGPGRARDVAEPPNGNLAVGVAGIASSTTSARELDLTGLGYRPEDVTYYSYRGLPDPGEAGIAAPYGPDDTLGSLRAAGHRLYDQLAALHAAHPGRAVDLIAHSQGGIVASYFMAYLYDPLDPMLPRVDHLVTLASPHQGADLATTISHLRTTPRGRWLLGVIEPVTRHLGLGIRADAVSLAQLAEDSDFIRQLNTRVIQRATAVRGGFDVVVTTPHAGRPDLPGRASCATHGGILGDERARRTVLAALRDQPLPPPGPGDDRVPAVVGGVIEDVEDALGGALERWAGYRPAPAP
jgi:hypothetical protein